MHSSQVGGPLWEKPRNHEDNAWPQPGEALCSSNRFGMGRLALVSLTLFCHLLLTLFSLSSSPPPSFFFFFFCFFFLIKFFCIALVVVLELAL